MGISDGSSDVCSADLFEQLDAGLGELQETHEEGQTDYLAKEQHLNDARQRVRELERAAQGAEFAEKSQRSKIRSEEHTSELQSLMRNSYAVFCLTKKIPQMN